MRHPNLLFLITDQQRADTIDPRSPCLTPNLDQLAAQGTRFDRCYAPSPICSPARASLMTGVLPHSHGMIDVTHAVDPARASLKPGLPTWPPALQAAGYRTGYFGKWHVERSNRLEPFGFDTYDVAGYHQLQGLVAVDEEMILRGVVRQKGYRDFTLYGVSPKPVEATAEHQLYSAGIHFLQEAARQPDKPWALFLSSEAPHDPYVVSHELFAQYDPAILPRPASFDDDLMLRPAIYRRIQRVWQDLSWHQFAQAIACYYAICTLIDQQVGRLLRVLEDLEQLDRTLIVFTSDHGDYMGDHRLMLKGIAPFEGAYRVPLLLKGPGVPAGRQVPQIVSTMDLGPTLVALTGSGAFPCQGRSLWPLLQAQPPPWRSEAFAECHGQRFFYTQRVLWQDHFKYVFNGFAEDELYDLAADPHELHNLAADPGSQPLLEHLAARMWKIMRETQDHHMLQAQYGMFRFAPVGPEPPAP